MYTNAFTMMSNRERVTFGNKHEVVLGNLCKHADGMHSQIHNDKSFVCDQSNVAFMGIGDGGGPIIRKKHSTDNSYVKFGHFSDKNDVKFRNFVNCPGKYHKNSGILITFGARIMWNSGILIISHTYFFGKNLLPPKVDLAPTPVVAFTDNIALIKHKQFHNSEKSFRCDILNEVLVGLVESSVSLKYCVASIVARSIQDLYRPPAMWGFISLVWPTVIGFFFFRGSLVTQWEVSDGFGASSGLWLADYFPSVLWCCWWWVFCLLTSKTVSQMTYTVLVEMLNPVQSLSNINICCSVKPYTCKKAFSKSDTNACIAVSHSDVHACTRQYAWDMCIV